GHVSRTFTAPLREVSLRNPNDGAIAFGAGGGAEIGIRTVADPVRPTGSVAVTVATWVPGVVNLCVTVMPLAVPPSSNAHVTTGSSPGSASTGPELNVTVSPAAADLGVTAASIVGAWRPYSYAPMSVLPLTARNSPARSA